MKGLLKNNFYATLSNAKVFAIIMLLLGVFVIAIDKKDTSLIIGYMLLAMIGFSFNSITSLRKESAGKWSKYKLTTPVKRSSIVQSYFLRAIFFPFFYIGGEERNEVCLFISLLCGIWLVMGLTTFINSLFPTPMTTIQIILGGSIIFLCALLAFIISCPVTTYIFRRKEY